MKKAVITILGIQGAKHIDDKPFVSDYNHQASYYFDEEDSSTKSYYLRNNLAHANSAKEIRELKKLFEKLFGRFQSYCIQNDILNINKTN
ncbi:MAG: hypothetical protein JJW00_04280 [Sulfurimonas sp.]|nr:hypothetical protein [Sulfurimonas sp.]